MAETAKKPGIFKRMSKYLRDVSNEFKKITWLSWSQTWKNTLIVVVTVAVFAVVVWGLDFLFSWIRSLIIGAF